MPTMTTSLTALFLGIAIATVPVPAPASSETALRCEQQGGRMTAQGCDTRGADAFDLFGKVIIGTLLLMALGFGAPDKKPAK